MCINITIKVTDFIFLTRQATFSHLLKVRRRSPRELGDWHVGLAIAMGDCDWLLLLHLWGGAAKFDRSSSSPAGHCQGRYRACPSGQSLYLFTLIMPPSSLRILHTGCNKRSKQTKKKPVVLICFCVVPTDLWPREGQRRTHMVSPADSLYLRERHPHCFAWCSGSHPLHVRTDTNSNLLPFFPRTSSGRFQSGQSPAIP